MRVVITTRYLSEFRPWSGQYLHVDDKPLGDYRDLVDAEYQRAKAEHPENPAFHMRKMWFTGSPFADEILALARQVRGENYERTD